MGFRNYIECGRTDNIGTQSSKIHVGVDASAYIYAALEKLLPERAEKTMTLDEFRAKFAMAFIDEIKEIIKYFTPARIEKLYVAFDGVPSMAKILEQRRRRSLNAEAYKIRAADGIVFDSRIMLPVHSTIGGRGGLCDAVADFFDDDTLGFKRWISPSTVHGEAEHKLVAKLANIDAPVVICSNDNDVAVLLAFSATPTRARYVYNGTGTYNVNAVLRRTNISMDLNGAQNFALATCFLGNDFIPAPYPFVGAGRNVQQIMQTVLSEIGHKKCFDGKVMTREMLNVIININRICTVKYPQFMDRTGHRIAAQQIMEQERVPASGVQQYMLVCAIEWWLMVEAILTLYINVASRGYMEKTIAAYYTRMVNIPVDHLQAGLLILLELRDKNTPAAQKKLYFNILHAFASPFFQRLTTSELHIAPEEAVLAGPLLVSYHTRRMHISLAVPFAVMPPTIREIAIKELHPHIRGHGTHTEYLEKILLTEVADSPINYFSPLHWKLFPRGDPYVENADVIDFDTVAEQFTTGGQRVLSDQLAPR